MNMTPDPAMYGPATLCVTQGVSAFVTFLPKFSEIRRAHPETDPDIAADVRMGEVAAVTLTLGIGAVASSLTGSAVPSITAVITCLVLVILYESTLRAVRPMEQGALS